jgi:hypothetical protein
MPPSPPTAAVSLSPTPRSTCHAYRRLGLRFRRPTYTHKRCHPTLRLAPFRSPLLAASNPSALCRRQHRTQLPCTYGTLLYGLSCHMWLFVYKQVG